MNAIELLEVAAQKNYTTDSVTSKDGTRIGYRQYGRGAGVVLVQGAMGSAHNFAQLAEALSADFTIYVPDRRGRGLSPLTYQKGYTIQKDVEDLEALLLKTGAQFVFGLSSGAVIALTAAASLPAIHKLAVFEPPLFTKRPLPTAEMARFDRAIARGDTAAALTAAGKAIQLVPFMKFMPSWLINLLTNKMMEGEDRQPDSDYLSMRQLAPALQYDFQVIAEMHCQLQRWSGIQAEVLLLGGEKSPAFLKFDLDALAEVLPLARRVTLPGLGHAAAWNYDRQRNPTGNPEMVVQELRSFFG